jgi:hypothetical protein
MTFLSLFSTIRLFRHFILSNLEKKTEEIGEKKRIEREGLQHEAIASYKAMIVEGCAVPIEKSWLASRQTGCPLFAHTSDRGPAETKYSAV